MTFKLKNKSLIQFSCVLFHVERVEVHCTQSNTFNGMLLKESKVPYTDSNNSNTFNCTHVKRVESTVHKSIPVNLMILSLNLMKDTHWNWHCSCSLLYQQPDVI